MFSKKHEQNAFSGDERTAIDSKRRSVSGPSILGSGLHVVGKLKSMGDMQIDAQFEGDVICKSLVIGRHGTINGNIIADEISVYGRVNGDIRGRKIELAGTAEVDGDIVHQSITAEPGAFFNGNSRYSDDPLATKTTQVSRPNAKPQANLQSRSLLIEGETLKDQVS